MIQLPKYSMEEMVREPFMACTAGLLGKNRMI